MLAFLEQAEREHADYAAYLAGEILALSAISADAGGALALIHDRVGELISKNRS
jgi:hypothetical protein